MTGIALTFAAIVGWYVARFGRQRGESLWVCVLTGVGAVVAGCVVGFALEHAVRALVRWLA